MDYTSSCTSMPFDPSNGSGRKLASADRGRERRRNPRYPLVAESRITEIGSGTEIKLRTSDLSISGCYLDTISPLPNGTDIVVKISRDDGLFESSAKVVYVHPGMGMGVHFTDTKPAQQAILVRWIAEIAGSED
jgi:c-di-GMP-binding flagellar brake protein YcgR